MNVEEMTADQLMELAEQKAGEKLPATSTSKTIEVDGHTITVKPKRIASWVAFDVVRKINNKNATDFDKITNIFRLVEYITGLSEQDIVEMAGGEEAALNDVVALANNIIVAVYPKN